MDTSVERRRTRRYPVTLSARIRVDGRIHRAEILDVSAGGLLVSPAVGLSVAVGARLGIEAAMIGRVEARVVGVSGQGLHLRIEPEGQHYEAAVGRLSGLSLAW